MIRMKNFLKYKKNKDFNNVFYSLLSYCINPVVLIITTPILFGNLGSGNYGLWILINSVLNILGISNFGLGNAMIKIGSEKEAEENISVFNDIFSVTLSLSFILALSLNILVLIFGHYLFPLLSNVGSGSILEISYLLSGIVGLRIVNGIISGSYMAKQRYDINSKVNILYNLITSLLFTVIAITSGELNSLVLCLFISTILLLIINFIISNRLIPGLKYSLYFNKKTSIKIINYGLYSWFQVILSAINSQADKLIIGGLLGTNVLGYYTICMQIAAKIHEIPAAAGGYLFAKFSSLYETKNYLKIRDVYLQALRFSVFFIAVFAIVIFLFSKVILSIWISPDFANQHIELFKILIISVSLGAVGVIPYYFLNGTGFVKINTWISLFTSLVISCSYFLLVPYFEVMAIGIGKFLGVPLVVFSLYFIQQKVLKKSEKMNQEISLDG